MPITTKAVAATPVKVQQHGQRTNRRSKHIICFHYGGNHPILKCNDITFKEGEKIIASKNAEWDKTMAECQAL